MGAWEGIWKGMEAVEDAKYKNINLDLQERKLALVEKEYEDNAQLKIMDSFFTKNKGDYKYNKTSTNSGPEIKTGMEYLKSVKLDDNIISKIVSTNSPEAMKESIKLVNSLRQIHQDINGGVFDKDSFALKLNNVFSEASITGSDSNQFLENIIAAGEEAGLDVDSPIFMSTAKSIASSREGSAVFPSAITPKIATISEIDSVIKSSDRRNENSYNTLLVNSGKLDSVFSNQFKNKKITENERNIYLQDTASFQTQLKEIKKDKFLLNNTFKNKNKEAVLKAYPYFKGNEYFDSQFTKPNRNKYIDITSNNTKDSEFFMRYLLDNNILNFSFKIKKSATNSFFSGAGYEDVKINDYVYVDSQ